MVLIEVSKFMIERIAPIFLIVSAIIIIVSLVINKKKILNELGALKRNWLWCLLCVVIYLVLMFAYSPKVNLWYTDEFEYLEIAKNIRFTGKANFYCQYYTEDSYNCRSPFIAIGYPAALSFVYFLFGFNFHYSIYLNILVGALSVLLVYVITSLMFNKNHAFYSALIYSLIPFNIIWAGTAESNTFGVFMILFSLLMLLLYKKEKTKSLLLLFVFSFVLCLYSRHEFVLVLPFFLFIMFRNMEKKRFLITSAIVILLAAPNFLQAFIHLGDASGFDDAYTPQGALSFKNVDNSIRIWLFPIVTGKTMPVLFSVLFLGGFFLLLFSTKKNRNILLILSLLLIPFFGLSSFYYMASLAGRLILPLLIPFSMIAGYCAFWVSKSVKLFRWPLINLLIILIVAIPVFVGIGHNDKFFGYNVFGDISQKKSQYNLIDYVRTFEADDKIVFLATEPILYISTSNKVFVDQWSAVNIPGIIDHFKEKE